MAWNVVRNKDYYSQDTTWKGDCPRFAETATLSIHIRRKQYSKHDVELTPSCRLDGCCLLKEKNEKDTTCLLSCPVFEEYKNSHSY